MASLTTQLGGRLKVTGAVQRQIARTTRAVSCVHVRAAPHTGRSPAHHHHPPACGSPPVWAATCLLPVGLTGYRVHDGGAGATACVPRGEGSRQRCAAGRSILRRRRRVVVRGAVCGATGGSGHLQYGGSHHQPTGAALSACSTPFHPVTGTAMRAGGTLGAATHVFAAHDAAEWSRLARRLVWQATTVQASEGRLVQTERRRSITHTT